MALTRRPTKPPTRPDLQQSFPGRAADDLATLNLPFVGRAGFIVWELILAVTGGVAGALSPTDSAWEDRALWALVFAIVAAVIGILILYLLMIPVAIWRQRKEARIYIAFLNSAPDIRMRVPGSGMVRSVPLNLWKYNDHGGHWQIIIGRYEFTNGMENPAAFRVEVFAPEPWVICEYNVPNQLSTLDQGAAMNISMVKNKAWYGVGNFGPHESRDVAFIWLAFPLETSEEDRKDMNMTALRMMLEIELQVTETTLNRSIKFLAMEGYNPS
jgi:hypothetical protein